MRNEHPIAYDAHLLFAAWDGRSGTGGGVRREEEWDGRRSGTGGGAALVDFRPRNCEDFFFVRTFFNENNS